MMVNPVPHDLSTSDLWQYDPEEALKMWEEGFRPMRATSLKAGMIVAYRDTDIFQFAPVGATKSATALAVVHNEEFGEVKVLHGDQESSVDECDEVWAKPARERRG